MSRYYGSVLQRTTPYYKVLLLTTRQLRTTKYKLLLYYSVLQGTILRTTTYDLVLQSATPYYKVQLRTIKYYSVLQILQSTSKYYEVRLRTTKYYSDFKVVIPPYYKVLLRTSTCCPVLKSTTPYYKVLIRTNPFDSRNTLRKANYGMQSTKGLRHLF